MKVEDFDFDLPEELIAQTPLRERSASRLLCVNRQNQSLEHRHFYDLVEYLKPQDTLVINNSKVIPARLFGVKPDTGAHVEVLLLKSIGDNQWETLVKPGKRLREGALIQFGNGELMGEVLSHTTAGGRIIRFQYEGIFNEILDKLGEMPLPPYIKAKLEDRDRYQTVYAKYEGSAAAPTAGLHFTPELLERLRAKGVQIAELTLHVGLGTFRPVSVDNVEEHEMHSEYYELNEANARVIMETKQRGGRIIAVGTTSTRTLESIARKFGGEVKADQGWTDIFIYPGYSPFFIDGMITNFHLPKSTLIMLVSALAGQDLITKAYHEAIAERYRFFSFGDAMFIY